MCLGGPACNIEKSRLAMLCAKSQSATYRVCELDHKTDNNGRQNSPPITPQVDYCPHCGYDMPVNELLRKDFDEVICSKCGKAFSARRLEH